MQRAEGNPAENELGPGITEAQLTDAIAASGYPLQTVVAEKLASLKFSVTDEWPFLDEIEGKSKSLDVFAIRAVKRGSQGELFPTLSLLVECKRGGLPYIFFQSTGQSVHETFPAINGLRSETVEVKDSQLTKNVGIARCLGLDGLAFSNEPPLTSMLTRAARKGNKELELTGSATFHSTVLPLTTAFEHWTRQLTLVEPVAPTRTVFWPTISLAVCVIDGPMILAKGSPSAPVLELRPWIRLRRSEAKVVKDRIKQRRVYIDFVHASYFSEFMSTVQELEDVFAERVASHRAILEKAAAVTDKAGDWTWSDLKPPSDAQ